MDIEYLKERIILDEKIEDILIALQMKSPRDRGAYFSCGMPDGDNLSSTIVYKDSLNVEAYTRNIEDQYGHKDIISLVSYINNTYISESIKWICDVCGYDYYNRGKDVSLLANWVRDVYSSLNKDEEHEEDEHLEPIDESILCYFKRYANPLFLKDGISYNTQFEFELGYDLQHHMISIPIRDELGTLVGVKGRLFKDKIEKWENKYFYLHSCAKSKILYGLYKTLPYIKEKNEVIVVEAEKGVQQLWSMGVKNSVAISGHILSKSQVKKLTHLGVPIVLAFDEGCEFDKDGWVDKNFYTREFEKFLPQQNLYVVYDKSKKILESKESPSDNPNKWEVLYNNYKFKVRGD